MSDDRHVESDPQMAKLSETCSLCNRGYHPNLEIDIGDEPVRGEYRWGHVQCQRDHDRAFLEAFGDD